MTGRLAALAALGALALVAAQGQAHPGHAYVTVELAANSYTPQSVSIQVGDGVNWIWRGPDTNHSITADPGQAESFDSDPGEAPFLIFHSRGDNFTHLFQEAGRFTYSCRVHPEMTGVVTVRDSAKPYLGPLVVRPATTCAGAGCRRPRLVAEVTERSTARGTIELRRDGRWRVVRRLKRIALDRGRNSVALSTAGLDPGRYRVVLRATDPSGNTSNAARASFKLTRG